MLYPIQKMKLTCGMVKGNTGPIAMLFSIAITKERPIKETKHVIVMWTNLLFSLNTWRMECKFLF
jgi:hypothetical protein